MANGETAVVHREHRQMPDLHDTRHDAGVHDAELTDDDDNAQADLAGPEAGR